MENWYDKYFRYADKILKKDKNDIHEKLYYLYNDIHKPYTFSVYPERKEINPIRPFKAKFPMKMDFIDDAGLVFRYDKRDNKVHFLCTVLAYSVHLEIDALKTNRDETKRNA